MGFLTNWLEQYGYWVLFFALLLEMLALPFPGQVLMSYAGLLIFQGKLDWIVAILTAGAGVSTGVTLSYWIGFHLGTPFFNKYGARFHVGPDRLSQISNWFQKYGNKLLLVACFIPGVRHFTGYFAGVTRIPFRTYACYTYTGAFIWVTVFISLGKVLGPQWEQYHHTLNRYLIYVGITAALIFLLVYVYRRNKIRFIELLTSSLQKGISHFHSMGKVKFIVMAAFTVFAACLSLMIGMIQEYLENEFRLFDEVVSFIIHEAFDPSWGIWMNRFALLGSYYVFTPLIGLTIILIVWKGKDRMLELMCFAFVILGGEALDEGLRMLFQHVGPSTGSHEFPYTFPSEQTLISLTVCGFAAYLLVRHKGNLSIRLTVTLVVITLCLLVGISRIFFYVQYPSDVVAGYVFGGIWLSLNVILLETLRMLRRNIIREFNHSNL
ncbi:phosphatase PAP2 family protein [Paenibacillus sp. LMG 31461]|uniref:Phosphatase PAP2 family protein n=1 Tax=Paenibacillus plantarum TaxID=2654975 RepID=A0ABX1X410_9BACL|nr:bifunctional DedA family/phosphatase PAP2 family protein [Paenibacillus plantarum]NOU62750.1 phosphatase PAP2 family protein [Paenibacillus plantarum]